MKRDFVSIADLSQGELWALLELAQRLRSEWQSKGNAPLLADKALAMVFQKPSLRTRVSFEMAMHHLGGKAMYLSPDEIRLGVRESIPDVARVLSRYVDCIMARVFAHDHILQLAKHASVPVINGLSDYNHPCQALSDVLTILDRKSELANIKLTWVGDGNNVLHSLLFAGSKLGMHMRVATPPGYEPSKGVVTLAQRICKETGASLVLMTDPAAAVHDADVIYTDTWASMGQEEERARRLRVFPPYQVNAALVAKAKADVIVMHCLPAHRGEEITDEVADGPHSALFDQAENRMHAQKAILASLMG